MEYDLTHPWNTLDKWQQEYIAAEGNCFVLCGRQSGKTTACSIKMAIRAATKPNRSILIVAFTEKQAYNLFSKTLQYLSVKYRSMILMGNKKPTQHIINLSNGSKIMCYAAGETGMGLVGYTITDLVVDEAAAMNRQIFTLLSPTLSVTNGTMDLLSTPRGKEGYFYEASLRDDFKKFYISAEDCPRHKKEFLEAEKSRMTKLEYAQEYLALFLDDLKRLFSDDLIEQTCMLKRNPHAQGRFYLGVDIAGLGEDESCFSILQKLDKDNIVQIENLITKKTYTTQTFQKIIELEHQYNFKKIGVDDGGIGFGVFSELLKEVKTKGKTISLNNASRPLDRDEKHKTKLMKEEMYFNLLSLMEHKRIKLLDDDELKESLASIQWEINITEGQQSRLKIHGRYSHQTEGLIRAAWLAYADKSLNIFAF